MWPVAIRPPVVDHIVFHELDLSAQDMIKP